MKNKRIRYLILAVIISGITYSLFVFNDYREKDLDKVISFKLNNFTSLTVRDINDTYELETDDSKAATELLTFMQNYRVKKVSDRAFDDDLMNDRGFEIIINDGESDEIIALIHEYEVHNYEKGYYQVINGPIDLSWVKELNDKYQQ